MYNMKPFVAPKIKKLSDFFENSKQCKMFGMPKRSCKGLPSATYSKEKNMGKEEYENA